MQKGKQNMEENEILTNEEYTEDDITPIGAEDEETADLHDSEEGTEEEAQAEPEVQENVVDQNAIYAEARRVAERNARQAQTAIDNEFIRRFGHLKNPITGQPIRSQSDYLAALDAQEELRTKEQLKQNGVDPSLIDQAVANNPMVRQAQAVVEQQRQSQTMSRVFNDIAELMTIDPTIKGIQDVPPDAIQYVMDSARMGRDVNLVEAYKITNFGKMSENQKAAIHQQAINQAKGKNHLNPVNGVSTPDEGVEIPESELAMWKEMFPDKSKAELKKLYNKSM
jgi:hypothetical protein